MAYNKLQVPPLVQAFDKYVDREYYKLMSGFFSDYYVKVRTDSISHNTFIDIKCDSLYYKVFGVIKRV